MTRNSKIAVASSIILLLLFFSTDPQSIPSAVLMAPFILIFVVLSILISSVFGAYGLFKRKRLKAGLVSAAIPVLLLVLQSLGQLTLRDVLVIFTFFGVAYFYMSRLGAQQAA